MMALFDWLLSGPKFRQYQDTFALTRAAMLGGMAGATRRAMEQRQHVLWLSHFQSTFVELESQLQKYSIDFEVLSSAADSDQLCTALESTGAGRVTLTLTGMLRPSAGESRPLTRRDTPISIMVAERHPLIDEDERLLRFARQIPAKTSIGYFVSLEDPVVARFISPTIVQILENLGMGNHDLISSHMLTKSIGRSLRRLRGQLVPPVEDASSPQEWLELNQPS